MTCNQPNCHFIPQNAHHVTVCVLPTVHTVDAFGDVMGGATTSLLTPATTLTGKAATQLANIHTMHDKSTTKPFMIVIMAVLESYRPQLSWQLEGKEESTASFVGEKDSDLK